MKKLLGVFLLVAALLQADCDDTSTHKRNAWLMPIGRVVLTPSLGDHYGASLLAEGGLRDARANVTLGTQMEFGRLKVSGEYLTQRLSYVFNSGKTHKWVQQGAVGLDYQHLLDYQVLKALDLKGYYSYAPSRNLSSRECGNYTIQRRIAGSNAWGVNFGGVLTPFCEDLLNVTVGYDHVKYRRKHQHEKTVQGFGGSIDYTFRLQCCVDVNLKADFRRPYNYYGIKFAWHRDRNWTAGLWAGYTAGKYHLPRSTAAGIEFAYFFDDVCGCDTRPDCPPLWSACDLQAWVAVPAIYMPEVLAIVDQRADRNCIPPQSSPIPETIFNGLGDSVSFSEYFSGGNLVFSQTGMPDGAQGLVFDPITATISTTEDTDIDPGLYTITITGTNECGSTAQTFVLRVVFPA